MCEHFSVRDDWFDFILDYLANQAVLKAVNKSPVPTKAAGNLGIST